MRRLEDFSEEVAWRGAGRAEVQGREGRQREWQGQRWDRPGVFWLRGEAPSGWDVANKGAVGGGHEDGEVGRDLAFVGLQAG